ncbi:MAG: helix-hairpin-helix domain-containing protein, partial [Oceanicaulis sp.]
ERRFEARHGKDSPEPRSGDETRAAYDEADAHDDDRDRLANAAPMQAPGADAGPKEPGGLAGETSGGPGAPAPDASSSPAPDAKSGLAMTAPMQAPGADAGPLTDGPQGETSAGPGTPETGGGDELTRIKGLGPRAAEKLSGAGITSFAQIAAWTEEDVARYDALIAGRGRIARDDWVGQAKTLSGA